MVSPGGICQSAGAAALHSTLQMLTNGVVRSPVGGRGFLKHQHLLVEGQHSVRMGVGEREERGSATMGNCVPKNSRLSIMRSSSRFRAQSPSTVSSQGERSEGGMALGVPTVEEWQRSVSRRVGPQVHLQRKASKAWSLPEEKDRAHTTGEGLPLSATHVDVVCSALRAPSHLPVCALLFSLLVVFC